MKIFFKKPFNANPRGSEMKGNFSGIFVSEEKKVGKKEVKAEDTKVEKKMKGDSRFDYHYCNGANHMSSYYML